MTIILYLIVIAFLGVCFILPGILYEISDGTMTYWQVLSLMLGVVAACFGCWYYIAKKVKNPTLQAQDEAYLALHMSGVDMNNTQPAKIEKIKGKLEKNMPSFLFEKLFYGVLFWAVLSCIVMACDYNIIASPISQISASQTVWNADNIPMPHLYNGNLYVSNPDSVISQETEDSMNVMLKKLDKELGIESVVVIVNCIENADAFRMAQDIGNKYGVGDKATDRGLVIVIAYEDHKYFIAPGRGLEALLTDAECSQLARYYLVPFLKENNPDGAMKKLVDATYVLAKEKRLLEEPSAAELSDGAQSADDDFSAEDKVTFMLLGFWGLLYFFLNGKYEWLSAASSIGSGYTGYGRSRAGGGSKSWGSSSWGGNSWGGGFSHGGFGGGSFGGGGAGGSW